MSHNHYSYNKSPIELLTLLLGVSLLWACSGGSNDNNNLFAPVDSEFPGYAVVTLDAGDDLETRAQEALINAQPKTIIELPPGTYDFVGELSVSIDNIVLRGQGMDAAAGTVLRFGNQTTGSQSILATGNNFVAEDLAVEDSPGDAIKIEGSNGVTIRGVRIEWTNGPDENNGAYGLYPVQTRNVLIEDCEVRGASDAGVYVGQSENIIVRRNYVYENVAGIEIENSKFADVYDNETTRNTGGILVFDLPDPPVQGGEATRVFNNKIYDNNTKNFAPAGNIVGTVPTGTGLMIMANDDIEAFGNTITGNQSDGVVAVSYYISLNDFSDRLNYDPIPEKIYIHDNQISNNGYDPQELAGAISELVFNGDGQAVDVFYDSSGVGTDYGLPVEFPAGLDEANAICIVNNSPGISLGQANAYVLLNGLDPADPNKVPNPEELCTAEGEGLNAEAYLADCPNLSDYRLFANPTDPLVNANDGIPYDLNTPLFTDYAQKYRFVFVPQGTQAAYRDTAAFDFPVGTIIAKTFTIQADLWDNGSAQDIIETRLLIHRKDGWKALPYIWN